MALPAYSTAMTATALQVGMVFAPLLFYGLARKSGTILLATLLCSGLAMLQSAILFLPSPPFLAQLQYNWLQKLIAFLSVLLIAKALKISFPDCGFALPKRERPIVYAIWIGLAFAIVDSVEPLMQVIGPSTETICFQLTMPGLQEEPFYRGLLLIILDRALGRPWKLLGVEFGAGCLFSSALFAVGHLVGLDDHGQIIACSEIIPWLNMLVFALSMCWIRYKTDSVWPAVLAHNLDNGCAQLLAAILPRGGSIFHTDQSLRL